MTKWILASASPRRRELLQQMGIRDYTVIPAKGEERSLAADPGSYVEELARHKATEVFRRIQADPSAADGCADAEGPAQATGVRETRSRAGGSADTGGPAAAGPWAGPGGDDRICVIGADTIVVCGGEILGKPTDREDAARMIRSLQGRGHEVMTGVSLILGGAADAGGLICTDTFHVTTAVHVAPMDEEEIARYLATGEADDKAGAYGIQGAFGTFIEGIEGDYYNVVGLPIAALYQSLKRRNLL